MWFKVVVDGNNTKDSKEKVVEWNGKCKPIANDRHRRWLEEKRDSSPKPSEQEYDHDIIEEGQGQLER